MKIRSLIFAALTVASSAAIAVPAEAFSRAGCTATPTSQHPAAALLHQIDMSLSQGGPAERRACYYYARGLVHHLQGDLGAAIADYSRAIGWMAEYGDAYAARADAYDDLGQHETAANDYRLAAEHTNDSADQLTERCWVRALRGHALAPALQDCNESLHQQPADFNALTSRGLVYLRMADYPAAIADCESALKLQPQNASALFIRGLARLRTGDSAGGNADLSAAKTIGDRVEATFAIYSVKP
jgi:tetratricopeptide (TPR) repeat protein